MRRLLAVGALLLLAACSDNTTPPGGSPGGAENPTASAPAPDGSTTPGGNTGGIPGGADAKTICAAYTKAEGEAGAKLITILPKAAEAMGDPSQVPGVITELKVALGDYEKQLRAESNRTADGELKAAIDADLATIQATIKTVDTAGNDMEKVINSLNSPEFQKIGDKVKSLCEK